MKIKYLTIFFFTFSLFGQGNEVITARRRAAAAPATNTFTKVHGSGPQTCPSTTSCTLTHSAVTAGNLIFLVVTNGSGSTNYISTVTPPSGGGTWTVPSGANTCQGVNGSVGSISCGYVLVASSATANSIVVTFNNTGTYLIHFWEFSYTPGPISLDTQNIASDSASTTPAGVTLTLSGTKDVIFQSIYANAAPSAASGSYSANFNGWGNSGSTAGVNLSVGTAPTWTIGSSVTSFVSAAAFK